MQAVNNAIGIATILGAVLTAIGLIVMAWQLAVARSSNGGALKLGSRRDCDTATVTVSAVGPGSWHSLRCEVHGWGQYSPVNPLEVPQLLCTDPQVIWTIDIPEAETAELWFLVLWDEPFLGRMRTRAICGPVITPDEPGTAQWIWHWKWHRPRAWLLKFGLLDRIAPRSFLGKWIALPRRGNAGGRGPRARMDQLRGVPHAVQPRAFDTRLIG